MYRSSICDGPCWKRLGSPSPGLIPQLANCPLSQPVNCRSSLLPVVGWSAGTVSRTCQAARPATVTCSAGVAWCPFWAENAAAASCASFGSGLGPVFQWQESAYTTTSVMFSKAIAAKSLFRTANPSQQPSQPDGTSKVPMPLRKLYVPAGIDPSGKCRTAVSVGTAAVGLAGATVAGACVLGFAVLAGPVQPAKTAAATRTLTSLRIPIPPR